MKCVKNVKGEVKRIMNTTVEQFISRGWSLCPKSDWKTSRKGGEVNEVPEQTRKTKKNKKQKKAVDETEASK